MTLVTSFVTSATDTANTATLVTPTLTPAANALMLFWVYGKNNDTVHIWKYDADTFGDSLTVTKEAEVQLSGDAEYTLTLFSCKFDSTPGSGTITFRSRNNGDTADTNSRRRAVQIVEATGEPASSPLQTKTASSLTGGTVSATLDTSPASGSHVYGGLGANNMDSNVVTAGSGFTEVSEVRPGTGTNNILCFLEENESPTDGVVDFGSVDDEHLIIAVEIKEDAGATIVTPAVETTTLNEIAPAIGIAKTVTASIEAATVSEQAPTLQTGATVSPSIGQTQATLSEQAPTVSAGNTLTPTVEGSTLTDQAPTVIITVKPAVEVITLSEQAPTVVSQELVTPGVEVTTLSDLVPVISAGTTVSPSAEAFTASDQAPTIVISGSALATPGVETVNVTDITPGVSAGSSISPAAESATLADIAPSVLLQRIVTPPVEVLTIAEQTITLQIPVSILASVDVFTLSEQAPTIEVGKIVTPAAETLALSDLSVSTGGGVTVSPSIETIVVSDVAPSLQLAVTVLPNVVNLGLIEFAPGVVTGDNALVLPAHENVTLSDLAPVISGATIVSPAAEAVTLNEIQPGAINLGVVISVSVEASIIVDQTPTIQSEGSLVKATYATARTTIDEAATRNEAMTSVTHSRKTII